jgi:hypothetical protein
MFIATSTPNPKEKQISDCLCGYLLCVTFFAFLCFCGSKLLLAGKAAFKLKSLFGMKKVRMNEKLAWTILLLFLSVESFPQKTDSTNISNHFDVSVTLTTNGISTIPNFILGKPAAIFLMSVGKKISFEPELRFSLDAKPWMLIFWWRTDLMKSERHHIRVGINSQINFNKALVHDNGYAHDILAASRFLTADLSQSLYITKNYSAGIYYMYSHTLEKYGLKDLHYLAFRNNLLNISLPGRFYMKFSPQVYYLRLDEKDGFYFSETLTLAKRNFPLTVSSIMTNPIKTRIQINNHLLWNINLTYAFKNEYH